MVFSFCFLEVCKIEVSIGFKIGYIEFLISLYFLGRVGSYLVFGKWD